MFDADVDEVWEIAVADEDIFTVSRRMSESVRVGGVDVLLGRGVVERGGGGGRAGIRVFQVSDSEKVDGVVDSLPDVVEVEVGVHAFEIERVYLEVAGGVACEFTVEGEDRLVGVGDDGEAMRVLGVEGDDFPMLQDSGERFLDSL